MLARRLGQSEHCFGASVERMRHALSPGDAGRLRRVMRRSDDMRYH